MIEHLEQYSMAALCEALRVSSSGFYAWRRIRQQKVCALDQAVYQAYKAHAGRAGAPCLTGDVQALGVQVSQRTVGRSLQRQGLQCHTKRKFRHTTDSKHGLPVAPNLLNRNFITTKPNQVWVGDITYT
jgi:putative transposase